MKLPRGITTAPSSLHVTFKCTMFTKFTSVSIRFHYLLSFQQKRD
jgi:hypothetical protein